MSAARHGLRASAAESALPAFPRALALPAAARVLVFSPHPDDDVIGCGGALALHREAGARVRVVHVFDGALGAEPALRRREAEAAALSLGGLELEFWNLPEGHLPAPHEDLAGLWRVRAACAAFEPDLVYAPWAGEAHRDHHTVACVVRAALALAQADGGARSAAWAYEVSTPLPATRVLDVGAVWQRKLAALGSHASQLGATDLVRACSGLAAFRALVLPARTGHAEAFAPLDTGFPEGARERGLLRSARAAGVAAVAPVAPVAPVARGSTP